MAPRSQNRFYDFTSAWRGNGNTLSGESMNKADLVDRIAGACSISKAQATTAKDPSVKLAGAYYAANIGKVTSIDQFVGNFRLLSYALNAYGLSDQINAKALIKQVLEGGLANPKSLANTLPRWKAFAPSGESSRIFYDSCAMISTNGSSPPAWPLRACRRRSGRSWPARYLFTRCA